MCNTNNDHAEAMSNEEILLELKRKIEKEVAGTLYEFGEPDERKDFEKLYESAISVICVAYHKLEQDNAFLTEECARLHAELEKSKYEVKRLTAEVRALEGKR